MQSSNVISSGDWSALPPIGSTTKSTHAQMEKLLTGTRVWTDRDGRKVKGILIAVGASHIRLLASGRMFTVPRHELGSNDEGVLQGIPTDDQGRGRFSYLHLPGDSISRTWTDDRGRQFVGELVSRWGNNLMLQKRDRVYLVSTAQLSNNERLVVLHALRSETRLANLVR